MDMNTVFVYGTLKRGQSRNNVMMGGEYLGKGKTDSMFALVDLGPFPALCYGHGPARGEVYNVSDDTLRRLDIIEGVPHLYERDKINITLESGETISCWTYLKMDVDNTYTIQEWNGPSKQEWYC